MKRAVLILVITACLGFQPGPVYAQSSYLQVAGRDFVRGFKNITGAVFEIPATIHEYDQREGLAGVKHIAGFFDGSVQAVVRAVSGGWDLVVAFLPGMQSGYPVEPETLY